VKFGAHCDFIYKSIEIVSQTIIDCAANETVRTSPSPGIGPNVQRKPKQEGYVSINRRRFLKAGSVAALFAAVPLKNVCGQSWKDRDRSSSRNDGALAYYSKSTFETYLNSFFQLHTPDGVVAVKLEQVSDMPAPNGGECFTLLFRGGEYANRQDTYTIDHPSLGTFDLLLVPVGFDQQGAQGYLATINRLSLAEAVSKPRAKRKDSKTVRSHP